MSSDEFVIPEVSLTVVVLNERVAPAGAELCDNVIVPLKVFMLERRMMVWLFFPCRTMSVEGVGFIEKSGAPTTTVTMTECPSGEEIPVTFTE